MGWGAGVWKRGETVEGRTRARAKAGESQPGQARLKHTGLSERKRLKHTQLCAIRGQFPPFIILVCKAGGE